MEYLPFLWALQDEFISMKLELSYLTELCFENSSSRREVVTSFSLAGSCWPVVTISEILFLFCINFCFLEWYLEVPWPGLPQQHTQHCQTSSTDRPAHAGSPHCDPPLLRSPFNSKVLFLLQDKVESFWWHSWARVFLWDPKAISHFYNQGWWLFSSYPQMTDILSCLRGHKV